MAALLWKSISSANSSSRTYALDYAIAAADVDCKYSQELYGWMIPPEAIDHLCLVLSAVDNAKPTFSPASLGQPPIVSALLTATLRQSSTQQDEIRSCGYLKTWQCLQTFCFNSTGRWWITS